mgnify:CR=1 FL=1|jgi:phage-related protein
MSQSDLVSRLHSLEPGVIVELFELDLTSVGGSETLRFHAGTNEVYENIVWQGNRYVAFPLEVTGFEFAGRGAIARPSFKVANINNSFTNYIQSYEDLIGCKVLRKRTFARYLDAYCVISGQSLSGTCSNASYEDKTECLENSGTWTPYTSGTCTGTWYANSTEDATAFFEDDIFYIDRKSVENKVLVEFELAPSFDIEGVKLPKRQIIRNTCLWVYRHAECGYTGTDYYDENGSSVSTVEQDACGKRVSDCELRFGVSGSMPFGGFPGAGLKVG